MVADAVEMASQAVQGGRRSTLPELATVALAALAALRNVSGTAGADALARSRAAARRALEGHGTVPSVCKWATLLQASDRTSEIPPPMDAPTESSPSAIAAGDPVKLGTVQITPLRLADVVKVELLSGETAARVRELWLEHFREESSSVIAGVMTGPEYVAFRAASSACPTFIAPIRRESELLNLVWHAQGSSILYQSLQAFKGGAAGAGAGRADLVLTLFTELLDSHDLVLLHGQLCSDLLAKRQAAEAIRFTRCAYTQAQWLPWVKKFNLSPSTFDVEAFLAEFMLVR